MKYTVEITVVNNIDGRKVSYSIHNQEQPWTVQRARRWVAENETGPWQFYVVASRLVDEED